MRRVIDALNDLGPVERFTEINERGDVVMRSATAAVRELRCESGAPVG